MHKQHPQRTFLFFFKCHFQLFQTFNKSQFSATSLKRSDKVYLQPTSWGGCVPWRAEMTAAHSPGLRAQQCSGCTAALGYPQSQCANSGLGPTQRGETLELVHQSSVHQSQPQFSSHAWSHSCNLPHTLQSWVCQRHLHIVIIPKGFPTSHITKVGPIIGRADYQGRCSAFFWLFVSIFFVSNCR